MTDLAIDRIGHRGDGVAAGADGPVFVPYTLPGERVSAEVSGDRGRLTVVLEASPDRLEPPCPRFGICGGCLLQHWAPAPYAAFKRQLVIDALADRGLDAEVSDTVTLPPATRRRATFAGLMAGRVAEIGFTERGSHRIVSPAGCVVMLPILQAVLPALEAITNGVQPHKTAIDLAVLASETGFDVALFGVQRRDVDRLRPHLTDLAGRFDLARLSVGGEVIVERRAPVVTIDDTLVLPPPGGFLQASREAEAAMGTLVVAATTGARRVADLYAGVGTFALRLSRSAEVTAVEGDAGAAAALDRAARRLVHRHRIVVDRRDLANRPLVEKELSRFDAVVFDPPRAGAAEQSAKIARSKVPTVVAVSCNPATLARDLRLLVDGGYRIEAVTPIDQFLWSAHVEVVAVLRKR